VQPGHIVRVRDAVASCSPIQPLYNSLFRNSLALCAKQDAHPGRDIPLPFEGGSMPDTASRFGQKTETKISFVAFDGNPDFPLAREDFGL